MMPKNTLSGVLPHVIPDDLRKALASDKAAKAMWEDITPLARNEWICWVISTKRSETRKKHIQRMIADLKAGERRPCCWYGCIHRKDKKVSPSVKSLVINRRLKRIKN